MAAGNSNLQQRFMQLQKAKEGAQPESSKIQRVAHYIRNRKHFAKHYSPKLASFGPIHYGDPKLKQGEQYKQMWAATYIESTRQNPQTLHDKVVAGFENLMKNLFDEDLFSNNEQFSKYSDQGFTSTKEMICWTLFVDGCALLHVLEHAKLHDGQKMNVKVDQLVLVMQDVLLLENQLPYPLLKLLWRDTNGSTLIDTMRNFLRCHHWASKEDREKLYTATQYPPPSHLLHLQRTIILYDPSPKEANIQTQNNDMVTYRNIKELKAAGIGLKTSKTRRPSDISFSNGWLRSELILPEIVVDDTTAPTVLNLIAYEMCPDFKNDYGICSYVSFLDSLIDHPDDVKVLRSEQILLNSLGSDEEVANLFNTVSTDLVPDMERYAHLRADIEKHYKNKCKTWLALGYHTYFSNPWAIIAFHAAVLGLALTFIQTWYAFHPSK
ncbi:UPF0481 protein [Spatholobus suberectus]|nr:UPF0481 protein [Spatholobus suberectus]